MPNTSISFINALDFRLDNFFVDSSNLQTLLNISHLKDLYIQSTATPPQTHIVAVGSEDHWVTLSCTIDKEGIHWRGADSLVINRMFCLKLKAL